MRARLGVYVEQCNSGCHAFHLLKSLNSECNPCPFSPLTRILKKHSLRVLRIITEILTRGHYWILLDWRVKLLDK